MSKILTLKTKKRFLFFILSGLPVLFGSKANAQLCFSNIEGSSIRISSDRIPVNADNKSQYLQCEGNFSNVQGELQQLNTLKFSIPSMDRPDGGRLIKTEELNGVQTNNDIKFEMTHSMVLPELHIIHAIGYLIVQGIRTRVDFSFDYVENDSETITITTRKLIRLSDYKKQFLSVFESDSKRDVIHMDMKLVIRKPAKPSYIALLEE